MVSAQAREVVARTGRCRTTGTLGVSSVPVPLAAEGFPFPPHLFHLHFPLTCQLRKFSVDDSCPKPRSANLLLKESHLLIDNPLRFPFSLSLFAVSREAESMPPIFMVEPAPLVDVAASRHSHQIPRKFKCAASPRLSAFMASISPNYRPFQDRSYCCLLVRWFAPNWWSLVDCCPSKRSSAFVNAPLLVQLFGGVPTAFALGWGVCTICAFCFAVSTIYHGRSFRRSKPPW